MAEKTESYPTGLLKEANRVILELKELYRADMELREERIDELVRSFKDLQEAYEQLVEEREKMLKHALKAHRINYPDGTFIYRTKSLMSDDMGARGFERGDELKFVIVKTPLAKIIEK